MPDENLQLDSGFERRTMRQLVADGEAEFQARLPGTVFTRRSRLGVINRVLAGFTDYLFAFVKHLSRQYLGDLAQGPFLERHAGLFGIFRLPGTRATGTLDVTGESGSVIPAGTRWRNPDDVEVEATAETTIAAGTAAVPVRAVAAGTDGNLPAAAPLTLIAPLAGVDSDAAVDAGALTGGADDETDEALRRRLLDRIRRPPMGGAARDYEKWALEATPAVTRVWVAPLEMGVGTVTVRIAADDDPAGPVPGQAVIDTVQDYIDARRPVTADVFVVAPVAVPLDLTIELRQATTVAVQDAVRAALADLIREESNPGGTILISHLREAISGAAGEIDHVLQAPLADVTHQTGELAVLGVITFV